MMPAAAGIKLCQVAHQSALHKGLPRSLVFACLDDK